MSVRACSDASASAATTRRNDPATPGQQDRYQALLDAEVGRLTHELMHPRHQPSEINRPEEGHQSTR